MLISEEQCSAANVFDKTKAYNQRQMDFGLNSLPRLGWMRQDFDFLGQHESAGVLGIIICQVTHNAHDQRSYTSPTPLFSVLFSIRSVR